MAASASKSGGPSRPCVYIHVLSDATGTAAERMARAAMAQFYRHLSPAFVRHPFLKSIRHLKRILDEAQEQQAVVIYTINDRRLRSWLAQEQDKRDLIMLDMLGPLFRLIGARFGTMPELDSGLLREALGEKSLRLAEVINFTLRHDDGRNLRTLGMAQVILLGVSRTTKTPTSLYLSCNHGLKVANVPLAMGAEPPAKIFSLKRPRMVGLTISPERLAYIRRGRFKGRVLSGYSDMRTIREELAFGESVFEKIKGIRVIDVSQRPIEEVANFIVEGMPAS